MGKRSNFCILYLQVTSLQDFHIIEMIYFHGRSLKVIVFVFMLIFIRKYVDDKF